MNIDAKAALFVMQGQVATRAVKNSSDTAPGNTLHLSPSYDLASVLPEEVKHSENASEAYRFLFVFENFLRSFVVETLSHDTAQPWWDKIPTDVQTEVVKLEETEEMKSWMALGSRDKSALMTLPQLLRVIDHNWKTDFEEPVRDKALITQGRMIVHLRNTICHMTTIPPEELDRIRQVMRDWFRIVSP